MKKMITDISMVLILNDKISRKFSVTTTKEMIVNFWPVIICDLYVITSGDRKQAIKASRVKLLKVFIVSSYPYIAN